MDVADSKLTTRALPVWQVLAADLKTYGVTTAFGLMSDDTMGIVVGLDGQGVTFHAARQETHAVAMAEGYSTATGRLGVAVIGRGPAMANGLNGTVTASRTGSKTLVISGDPPILPSPLGLGPDLKGFNAKDVLAAAGVRTFIPTSPADARITLRDAVAAAERGGVAVLLLPGDVQEAKIEVAENEPPFIPQPRRAKPAAARQASIDAAVAVLAKAKRPLIIAGRGAHEAGAREALVKLAERIGGMGMTAVKGKDFWRDTPYDLGISGSSSHVMGRRFADQADCVIAFGASLNFLTLSSGKAIPQVPLIHVDVARKAVGQWWFADVGIVGDARVVAEQLLAALPERAAEDKPYHAPEMRKLLADYTQEQDFKPAHTPRTLDPRTLAIALDQMLPRQRNVVWDSGNFFQAVQYVSVPDPGHFKFTTDFGSIGLGLPTAIGYAKGRPEVPTVALLGDGGLLMSFGELESVIREDVPLVIAVFNDAAYGAEVQILKLREMPTVRAVFPDVDFAPIAEALGFDAHTIRTMDDLAKLKDLLADPQGPIFLDCKVNGAVASAVFSEFVNLEAGK